MVSMLILQAEQRDAKGGIGALRREGKIPAVMYGPREESVSLAVDGKKFGGVWEEAGESTVVALETPIGKKSVLIHEVQLDPVKNTPLHIDFYVVETGKEVEVSVPIDFTGVSPAAKSLGGVLVKVMHEMPVKGLPDRLPHRIEVDISSLTALDSHIAVGDVPLPEGIEPTVSAEEIVASVSAAAEEAEAEESADLSSIEVERKGKKEEEEGSA